MTTKDELIRELIEENTKLRKMLGEKDPCNEGETKMIDAVQMMRTMILALAPPEHRGLPKAELRRLGYTENAADALTKASKEQSSER